MLPETLPAPQEWLTGPSYGRATAADLETRLKQYRLWGLLGCLAGDLVLSEHCFPPVAQVERGWPIADVALAQLYAEDGRPGLALPLLQRAVTELPEVRGLDLDLIQVTLELGDERDALRRLAAVETTATNRSRLQFLEAWAREASAPASATERYEALIAEDPHMPEPWYRLALLELSAGETARAAGRLEALVGEWPYVTRYRRALASAKLRLGDIDDYLAQARYVLEARFGIYQSKGDIRNLLDILRLGGLEGLYLRGTEATDGSGSPGLEGPPDSFWREVAGYESREAVETELLRSMR